MWQLYLKYFFYLFESKCLDDLQLYEGIVIPSAIKFQVQIIFCLSLPLDTVSSPHNVQELFTTNPVTFLCTVTYHFLQLQFGP